MRLAAGLLMVAASLFTAMPASAQDIRDGEALLTAMHARYENSWYSNVTFTERATTLNPDGASKNEIWYEALELPGKLRINIGPASEGNGMLFLDNTLTRFKQGKIVQTRPFVHILLVLGFDIYRQDAKTTIDEVKAQGFDLKQIHEEKWEGQDVYVVGAAKGDLKSKQFWIEKKRLLFLRVLEPDEQDATKMQDNRFSDYRRLPGGWIAAHVDFYKGGKMAFTEQYWDIKENVKLEPDFFEPARFEQDFGKNEQNK
ncbi:MAG: hypothetical protein WA542_10480 [Candidatus Acidiferrum sp.]